MRKYKCPNNCRLPRRKKELVEKDGKWGFDYHDFTYCPVCGEMMPQTHEAVKRFFDIYHLNSKLDRAEQLIYKSEFNAAAREAFVVVETALRNKSGLDLHGVDLVNKALSYDVDKKSGQITKIPLIQLNNLITDSEKNEQEGVRFMLMGFFQGARNIFQHNKVGSGASDVLSIIIQASYFLNLLDGHSITKHGEWIRTKVDYSDIYQNMPNHIDRLKLRCILRFRNWKHKKMQSKIKDTCES
ncbi:TIGR02391 family protein [Eubacterium oxidoreducens]|uniref:TIGR02391 family protein n=1 Tax=Eubacterium oxidoreducens TaxID=1732 RepID=A0A1G6B791_EUBOX|nr:TIGR02391 family protein [Eubacterium oxidoreducens]SDB16492.1 TIGR02391 family protein [Eubacterium oxidoreducens]